jgi:transposase InsO family protein
VLADINLEGGPTLVSQVLCNGVIVALGCRRNAHPARLTKRDDRLTREMRCRDLRALIHRPSPSPQRVSQHAGDEARRPHRVRGRPIMCISDNGTELTSMAILAGRRSEWSNGTTSRQGKPQQNAFAESFIGRCPMNC